MEPNTSSNQSSGAEEMTFPALVRATRHRRRTTPSIAWRVLHSRRQVAFSPRSTVQSMRRTAPWTVPSKRQIQLLTG
jgi:hypothetical protein